jgi:uncharacterized protein YndB with AHSA1/START domain
MTTENLVVVRLTHRFAASAERVFDAWLNPASACKWLFATPSGEMVRTEIDARVGGSFNLTERRDAGDVEHIGEYLEIERPRRLAFTFAVPKYSPLYTRVSIDIVPTEAGCQLALTQEGVLPEWASRCEKGWSEILDGLGLVI